MNINSFNDKIDKVKGRALLKLTFICLILGVSAAFTENALLTIVGIGLLPLFFLLLWRPGEPPVLLFAVCYQWLQVFVPVINSNFQGIKVGDNIALEEMEIAAWLGLATVSVLALGLRIGSGIYWRISYPKLKVLSQDIKPAKVLLGYILAFILILPLIFLSAQLPGIAQFINAFEISRWIMIFIAIWLAVEYRQFLPLAFFLIIIEIIIGFLGYFSGFKLIIFLSIVIIAGREVHQIRLFRPTIIILTLLVIWLGLFWQTIKPDYREYLNQGTSQQVVLVSVAERLGFIMQRIPEVNSDDMLKGAESTISRIGYIEYFARTISMVPAVIPHEDGKLWWQVAEHIFFPRILYPDKASVNDSDRTNMYTGITVAGADRGVSIGIGYAAESYIDYGKVFMFIPILGIGIFLGLCYRLLIISTPYTLLGLATSTIFILQIATLFETSNIKIVGGSIVFMIVWIPILTFGGRFIWEFLSVTRNSK